MNEFENENIFVGPSQIEGLGVFAKRNFVKGETVLRWNPKALTEQEFKNIPPEQKRYLFKLENGINVLMQSPEKFVNSSDSPNTHTVGQSDVAIRDIKVGEEITSNYPLGD
ncbi:SET domain-containing protein [Patescibacteria group bacterium]|nr:SET domain-containing protein [Patescibacteria group bacterium]